MRISVAILFALLFAIPTFADNICPDYAKPDGPIREYMNIEPNDGEPLGYHLDTMTYYWQHGEFFRHPLGYNTNFLISDYNDQKLGMFIERAESAETKDGLLSFMAANPAGFHFGSIEKPFDITEDEKNAEGHDVFATASGWPEFAFWMPSKRYVRRESVRSISGQFYLCESGFPRPNGDEYIVRFDILRAYVPNSKTSKQTLGMRNVRKKIQDGSKPNMFSTFPFDQSFGEDFYIWNDDENFTANLSCATNWPNPDHGICRGMVWVEKEDLILYVTFPSDKSVFGEEVYWKDNIMAALSFVNEWHEKGME